MSTVDYTRYIRIIHCRPCCNVYLINWVLRPTKTCRNFSYALEQTYWHQNMIRIKSRRICRVNKFINTISRKCVYIKILFLQCAVNCTSVWFQFRASVITFALRAVVQNCCKGDEPCQWNTPIFIPSRIENSWTDRHQIWQGWQD